MPTPLKPCEGRLSDQNQESLRRNRNREQWAQHRCETCGRIVGVEIAVGKWQPERHWPSISYPARKTAVTSTRSVASRDSADHIPVEAA